MDGSDDKLQLALSYGPIVSVLLAPLIRSLPGSLEQTKGKIRGLFDRVGNVGRTGRREDAKTSLMISISEILLSIAM